MRRTPRTRACRFSAASPARPPSISSASASWNARDRRLDRDLAERAAQGLGDGAGVAARSLGAVPRRHRDAVHALGAERLGAESRRDRRVDATRDGDDDLREAVLLDVVAQAERERAAHLLELRGERGGRSFDLLWMLAGCGELDDLDARGALARAIELAAAGVSQAAAHRLGRIDVDDEEALFEARLRARRPHPSRRARPSARRRPARPGRRRGCRRRSTSSSPVRASRASPRAPPPCRRGTARRRGSR